MGKRQLLLLTVVCVFFCLCAGFAHAQVVGDNQALTAFGATPDATPPFTAEPLSEDAASPDAAASATKAVLFDHIKREDAGTSAYWVICNGYEPNPSPAAPTKETDWNGGISSWAFDLYKKGYKVQTLPQSGGRLSYGDSTNPEDLSNYQVYIIPECYYYFTAAEKQAIYSFVENGGGLFLEGNHLGATRLSGTDSTSTDAFHVFNDLGTVSGVNIFGWTFVTGHGPSDPDENINPTGFTTSTNSAALALVKGPNGTLTEMNFSAYAYLTLDTIGNSTVQPILVTSVSGDTGYLIATCTYGKGRVVVITDSAPADDGTTTTSGKSLYVTYSTNSNRAFFLNAVDYLAGTGSAANTVTASITAPSSNTTVASGTAVAFTGTATDSSSTATLTYAWNFGDGTTATGASASHTFTNTGTSAVTDTVTLTATDNTGATGTATRTVTVNPGAQTVVVTVSPTSASLSTGATQQFTATVTGTTNTAVTWTATGGTVSTSGLYTAPATAGTYTVKATSAADTTKSASATVTVTASTGSTLLEAFESGSKTAYTNGNVTLSTGSWALDDALLGNTSSDRKDGSQSVRMRNSGMLIMNFNFPTGAKTVTVKHAKYGSDGSTTWSLWYSTNSGSTWTQVGSTVTTSSTTLATATFTVNITGVIRFEIKKTDGTSARVNFDDFQINGY